MERLLNLAKRAMALDENYLLNIILADVELQKAILDLNRIGQLFEQGVNSQGVPLKEIGGSMFTESGYSPYTIMIKEEKGQRTDHITLRDTGAFYGSFVLILGDKEFIIDADPIKEDGTDLFREWGEDILGLTEESREILKGFVLERLRPVIMDYLLAA